MSSPEADPAESQSSTRTLVRRTRLGDGAAGNRLFTRIVRRVRWWAQGRLHRQARDMTDTVDVVQEAAVGVWRNLDRIQLKAPGDLEAYLMRAVRNRIQDEARKANARPLSTHFDSQLPDQAPTPLELLVGAEQSAEFQAAFSQLTNDERESILARYEYGYSYEETASVLGKPSAVAARMAVNRAVAHLRLVMRSSRD
jgi:RNA polymerase sigma factor (sigma-70 family)